MKKNLILLACLALANPIQAFSSIESEHKKIVNVIAFYGFLEDPKIKNAVEKQCNVKFSHDTYFTNAEFLHTFNKQKDYYAVIRTNASNLIHLFQVNLVLLLQLITPKY